MEKRYGVVLTVDRITTKGGGGFYLKWKLLDNLARNVMMAFIKLPTKRARNTCC